MDAKIMLGVISLVAIINAHPIENQGSNVVPGIFISADALKDLQDRAQQHDTNVHTTNLSELKVNSVPGEQQIASNQQQQPIIIKDNLAQPVIANQPQVVLTQQTPSTQQMSQPNQILVTQQQPVISKPIYVSQQPSNQQLVYQQPELSNQQSILLNQQGQPTWVIQNGQLMQIGQQTLVSGGNPVAVLQKPIQTSGTIYAVVNGQNSGGNTYLVPVQQMQQTPSNQMFTVVQ